MKEANSYIARETALSSVINAAISVGFFLAVFGFAADVPVWGVGNYAFDFLPQSFAVAFFGSFVPSLLTRKSVLRGELASGKGQIASVASLLKVSILMVLGAMVLGAGTWAGLLWLSGAEAIAFTPAFTLKVIYGGVLGAFVTRHRLRALLG